MVTLIMRLEPTVIAGALGINPQRYELIAGALGINPQRYELIAGVLGINPQRYELITVGVYPTT